MEFYINDYLTQDMIDKKEQNEDLIIIFIYNPNTEGVETHIEKLKEVFFEWYDKIEFKKIPNDTLVEIDKVYLTCEIKPFVMPSTPFEVTPMDPLEWLKRTVNHEILPIFGEKVVVMYNSEEEK